MHPDDRRPAGEFDRILGEGLPLDRELRIIQPNGKLRWISSRTEVHLDKSGTPTRAYGVALDVTSQREIALARDAADSRFRALVVATNSFVWTADAEGNLLDIRNWRELRGENPADLLGSRWIDLVHPDDRERTLKAWNAAINLKNEYQVEHRVRQPDGSYRWMLSRAAPIMLETGAVREWVGISSDIHDSKVWPATSGAEQTVLTGAQIRAGARRRQLVGAGIVGSRKDFEFDHPASGRIERPAGDGRSVSGPAPGRRWKMPAWSSCFRRTASPASAQPEALLPPPVRFPAGHSAAAADLSLAHA